MNVLQTIDLKKYYGSKPNIVHALITKPTIILADELVGNLDSKSSTDVLSLLKSTRMEFNQLANRIVWIEDDRIVELEMGGGRL